VACTIPEEGTNAKVSENKDSNYNESKGDGAKSYDDDDYPKKPKDTCSAPRSPVSYGHDPVSRRGSYSDEWHADLLGCCSEPALCFKTLFFPCGTFSRIDSVAKDRPMSSGEACNDIMAYSLILSCCCYTCCVRRKLRQKLDIAGGCCDDFLSHLLCCCCALVQEWREVEIRGAYGEKTKTTPPPCQYMEH